MKTTGRSGSKRQHVAAAAGRAVPAGRTSNTLSNLSASPGVTAQRQRLVNAFGFPAQPQRKQQPPRSGERVRGAPAAPAVIQLLNEVRIGGVLSVDAEFNAKVRAKARDGYTGEMWFNDRAEAEKFVAETAEGMGVWHDRWINLAGKGTILFGEKEHNAIREDLVAHLNIRHRLVEGASERTLHGVPEGSIPPSRTADNRKYRGDEVGKALENYWLRSGQYMAFAAAPVLAQLKALAAGESASASSAAAPAATTVKPLKRAEELIELIRTLKGVDLPEAAETKGGSQSEIVDALETAKSSAVRCEKADLQEFLDKSKETDKRRGVQVFRRYAIRLKADREKAERLYDCFASLASAVERLGTLQFLATATPEEIAADKERVEAAERTSREGGVLEGFEVWPARRDTAIIANLRDALGETPPPVLVTMGEGHVDNLGKAIADLPNVVVVTGSIEDLIKLGQR